MSAPRRAPPGSRPTDTSMHRPKSPLQMLIVIALVVMLIPVPAAAADIVLNEHMLYFLDTSDSVENSYGNFPGAGDADRIILNKIEDHKGLQYIGILCHGSRPYLEEGTHSINYTLNGVEKEGVVYVDHITNILGSVTGARFTLFFYDWDVSGLSGREVITLSESLGRFSTSAYELVPTDGPGGLGIYRSQDNSYMATGSVTITFTVVSSTNFESEITVEDTGIMYEAVYERYGHPSYIEFRDNDAVVYSDMNQEDLDLMFLRNEFDEIYIDSLVGVNYTFPVTGSGGLETPGIVTVYVKNSQTGALLANANLAILAAAAGTETEVVNATLPDGTGTYPLQPTGGGSPNPDYYRAVATVPGYTQIIENHSFTLNGPHDVIIEMRPDTGGPTDPERAYLEFYVRDLNANPIPAASIQCGGRILQTNSAGYAVFEVAKNASHPWIAKKANYVTIEGTATTGPNPRYVVNVVLGPGTVPTHTPTPGPTVPGATPTPDTRTNEQKGQEVIDLIADFALPIAILAILATLSGLLTMMMPRRR